MGELKYTKRCSESSVKGRCEKVTLLGGGEKVKRRGVA